MAIIVTENNKNAKILKKAPVDKEAYLQEYIHNNPDLIPIYEIQEEKRLLVLTRELRTNSGLIDALAIDQDGDIYIVETKLYKNPDKRLVVAQALDYGAALWRYFDNFDELILIFNRDIEKAFGISLQEKLAEFYELGPEQVDQTFDLLKDNFENGDFKFVILMDEFDERLKDLIIYINQNSKFDIYAVQVEFYRHDNFEIMIPKIFGVEVKKSISKTSSGRQSRRYKWDEIGFMNELNVLDQNTKQKVLNILIYAKEANCLEGWGTGKVPAFSFKIENPHSGQKVSVFTIWADGTINIGAWLHRFEENLPEIINEFFKKVDAIDGIKTTRQLKLKDRINLSSISEKSIESFKELVFWLRDNISQSESGEPQ